LLTSAEAKLAGLDNEKAEILKKADVEAAAEKQRIAEETDDDVRRLREQVSSEVERLEKQIFVRLKQFSANESVRLAEEKLKAQMDQDKDSRLVKSGIASIGGLS
jgi:F0F1-type ATP synthase membrane subunit b/b'